MVHFSLSSYHTGPIYMDVHLVSHNNSELSPEYTQLFHDLFFHFFLEETFENVSSPLLVFQLRVQTLL